MPEGTIVVEKRTVSLDWKQIKGLIPFLGLAAVILFFQIVSEGRLLSLSNLKTVLNEGIFIMIGAIGYSFIMTQGNLDFSVGPNMAVSCSVIAIVAASNPLLGVILGVLTGTIIGALNGLLHVFGKISAFVATLAMQFILSGLVIILLNGGFVSAPLPMLEWNTVSLKLTVLTIIAVLGFLLFNYTKFGKNARAVGSNEQAAFLSGVNVKAVKMFPFIIMGFLVGVLSLFSLIRTGTASNQTGSDFLMNVLNAVLLGGMPITGGASARYRAAIVGSVTMAFFTNGMAMMGVDSYDRQLIKGLVFLITIALSFDRKNMPVIK